MRTTEDILDTIRQHGREAYPEECCGFLLGRAGPEGNRVTALHRASNRHPNNRERRYAIPPGEYRAADEAARRQGLDVVGFYHSHPDHPARPSETDLREATFPGYTYVIVSVRDGAPEDMTAWHLAPDRSQFEKEAIT